MTRCGPPTSSDLQPIDASWRTQRVGTMTMPLPFLVALSLYPRWRWQSSGTTVRVPARARMFAGGNLWEISAAIGQVWGGMGMGGMLDTPDTSIVVWLLSCMGAMNGRGGTHRAQRKSTQCKGTSSHAAQSGLGGDNLETTTVRASTRRDATAKNCGT